MRGPETVACIGWSHRTPDAAFWTDGRLRVTKDHPDWLGLDGWENDYGDGTDGAKFSRRCRSRWTTTSTARSG